MGPEGAESEPFTNCIRSESKKRMRGEGYHLQLMPEPTQAGFTD